MPTVHFAPSIQRHTDAAPRDGQGATLREVLADALDGDRRLAGYVLDDRGAIRDHVAVFIGGKLAEDRLELSDVVPPDAEVYVFQALSGG